MRENFFEAFRMYKNCYKQIEVAESIAALKKGVYLICHSENKAFNVSVKNLKYYGFFLFLKI